MPALFLTEDEVTNLIDMPAAIDAVRCAFEHWAAGEAENQPRRRVSAGSVMLHTLSAADSRLGYAGCKIYSTTRQGARFHFSLYGKDGELLAVMEADRLGQIRTGAVSGAATRVMARSDAAIVGCFGTGWQAQSQLQAICAVRTIRRIDVYGRDADRRTKFAREMSNLLGVAVEPADTPRQTATDKDIVITATTSKSPVFDGSDLSEGTHLCVIGGNYLTKAEVDSTTIRRADSIVCDSIEACRLEAGEFVPALQDGSFSWDRAKELRDIVAGRETARSTAQQITLFKSVGLALEDLAVGVEVYQKAVAQGIGKPGGY